MNYLLTALQALSSGLRAIAGRIAPPSDAGTPGDSAVATRQLAATNTQLQAVLDYAVDGMMTLNDDGVILTFNPAAERIFGYRAEEVLGQSVRKILPEPYHVEYKLISAGSEVQGRRRDGAIFPMEMTSGQMLIDGRRMYIVVARDITRRKRAEEELERARDAAQDANRAKSAFLLTMTHELRTPLNHIIGYSEMLREEAEARHIDDFVSDLQRIDSAARHLLAMISDILDISRIEAGEIVLEYEPFSIASLVQSVVYAAQPLAERNHNTIEVICSDQIGTMVADSARVRQVLVNILNNACKFTEHGHVVLEVSREHADDRPPATALIDGAAPRWGQVIVFRIQDTGIGMTDEQMQQLFQPFMQADSSTTRRYGGTGLGLAISQRLCQLMHGSITAHSEPAQGSVFTVVLPADVTAAHRGVRERVP